MSLRRSAVVALLAVLTVLLAALPAAAVNPGKNGRIAFTSGRQAGDATAQIFFINPVNPLQLEGPFSIPGVQNRHASFSPDRTKIVFSSGTPGTLATEQYDLFVKDLVGGSVTALDASESLDALSDDHAAWSPDGTKIAYEHQPVDNSTERDIRIKSVNTSADGVDLTSPNAAPFQLKPAWSPDGNTLYFAQSPQPTGVAGENFDIVRKSPTAAAGDPTTNVLATAASEYQPSISPDGTKICYTEQTPLTQTSAEIFIQDLPTGGNKRNISDNAGGGDINCSYSPDGSKVAFSNGIFTGARLMTESTNDNDTNPATNEIANDTGNNDFDGNADWGVDGSPDCPDSTVSTPVNTPITLQLECTDTGPAYERTDPNGFIANDGGPANGTTSDSAPTSNPSTVKYTPNAGFAGIDKITFTAFDDFGFGTDKGVVTINVKAPDTGNGGGNAAKPKCGGKTATIVGTNGKDTLKGTKKADVIVGLRGNDKITGGGGKDRICSGSGRDRVGGGSGNDRIAGGSGNDRLGGDSGNDSVKGEGGNDSVGGGKGNDKLFGGAGKDKVSGGSGRDQLDGGASKDRLNGGSGRDRCRGGSGKDRGSRCEKKSKIP